MTVVGYQVRDARITDAERITRLLDTGPSRPEVEGRTTLDAGDLLRQLVYLPHAAVIVAEAYRAIVGAAVLSLRPSVVGGGFIGTIDLLVVEPGPEATEVQDALVAAMLRSARNKGCVAVEAPQLGEPVDRATWERYGFAEAAPRMVHQLAPVRVLRT
jgi:N-acetylglutamate synthase-like GNAT family acetyltransferase